MLTLQSPSSALTMWQEVTDRSVMTVMCGQEPVIEPLELAA